jgi:hypothetical protein
MKGNRMTTEQTTDEKNQIAATFIGALIEVSAFSIDMQLYGEINRQALFNVERRDWNYEHFDLQLSCSHEWADFELKIINSPLNAVSDTDDDGILVAQFYEVRFPIKVMDLLGELLRQDVWDGKNAVPNCYTISFDLFLDRDGAVVWSGIHGDVTSFALGEGGGDLLGKFSNEHLQQLSEISGVLKLFRDQAQNLQDYDPGNASCRSIRDARMLLTKLPDLMHPSFHKYITHFNMTGDIEAILSPLRRSM